MDTSNTQPIQKTGSVAHKQSRFGGFGRRKSGDAGNSGKGMTANEIPPLVKFPCFGVYRIGVERNDKGGAHQEIFNFDMDEKILHIFRHEDLVESHDFNSVEKVIQVPSHALAFSVYFRTGASSFMAQTPENRTAICELLSKIVSEEDDSQSIRTQFPTCLKHGMIEKKGKYKWAPRYVFLIPGSLFVFRYPDARAPLQIITVNRLYTKSLSDSSFTIYTKQREFTFKVSNSYDCNGWIRSITEAGKSEEELASSLKQMELQREDIYAPISYNRVATPINASKAKGAMLPASIPAAPEAPAPARPESMNLGTTEALSKKLQDTDSLNYFDDDLSKVDYLVEGTVFTCGRTSMGHSQVYPLKLESLPEQSIRWVAAGTEHILAINDEFELFSWGKGTYGRLGHGDERDQSQAKLVRALRNHHIVQVACGGMHSIALTDSGEIYVWGAGSAGQLGNGMWRDAVSPIFLEHLEGRNIKQVAAGHNFTAVLTHSGEVLTWGGGDAGQLGLGSKGNMATPQSITALQGKRIAHISCGFKHMCAVTREGKLYCWGNGLQGQLGRGMNANQSSPCVIDVLVNVPIVSAACGKYHMVAASVDGSLYAWGREDLVGHENTTKAKFPHHLDSVEDNIVHVTCGPTHSMAISDLGKVYSWGSGQCGRLGHGDERDAIQPREVRKFSALTGRHVRSIALGDTSSFILVGPKTLKSRHPEDNYDAPLPPVPDMAPPQHSAPFMGGQMPRPANTMNYGVIAFDVSGSPIVYDAFGNPIPLSSTPYTSQLQDVAQGVPVALPSGWEQRVDPISGGTFYVDVATRMTHYQPPLVLPTGWQFHKNVSTGAIEYLDNQSGTVYAALPDGSRPLPAPLQHVPIPFVDADTAQPVTYQGTNQDLSPEWKEYLTPDGSKYYFNTITQETQWEKPPTAQAIEFGVGIEGIVAREVFGMDGQQLTLQDAENGTPVFDSCGRALDRTGRIQAYDAQGVPLIYDAHGQLRTTDGELIHPGTPRFDSLGRVLSPRPQMDIQGKIVTPAAVQAYDALGNPILRRPDGVAIHSDGTLMDDKQPRYDAYGNELDCLCRPLPPQAVRMYDASGAPICVGIDGRHYTPDGRIVPHSAPHFDYEGNALAMESVCQADTILPILQAAAKCAQPSTDLWGHDVTPSTLLADSFGRPVTVGPDGGFYSMDGTLMSMSAPMFDGHGRLLPKLGQVLDSQGKAVPVGEDCLPVLSNGVYFTDSYHGVNRDGIINQYAIRFADPNLKDAVYAQSLGNGSDPRELCAIRPGVYQLNICLEGDANSPIGFVEIDDSATLSEVRDTILLELDTVENFIFMLRSTPFSQSQERTKSAADFLPHVEIRPLDAKGNPLDMSKTEILMSKRPRRVFKGKIARRILEEERANREKRQFDAIMKKVRDGDYLKKTNLDLCES